MLPWCKFSPLCMGHDPLTSNLIWKNLSVALELSFEWNTC